MKPASHAFELKNLFRNVYFWLAVGGAIFLLYVGFIAFTFLPRSTSEVMNANTNAAENTPTDKQIVSSQTPKKSVSTKGTGKLTGARITLVKNGGWVDSDDRKITIIMRVERLGKETVSEIIRAGGVEIEIDGRAATIINSEPFGSGFLTRAEAVLSVEKFDKFTNGETQTVEIKTVLHYGSDGATDFENPRFAKRKDNKTEIEGVKIDWK